MITATLPAAATFASPSPATPTPHRFSVTEYERMVMSGILEEDLPIELIRGEIVDKMPTGLTHAWVVRLLVDLFNAQLKSKASYISQTSLRLEDSLPEPDFALLRHRADDYLAQPGPHSSDVLLIAEVAETSIYTDRQTKQELYAENGIPEYWIINLVDRTLEVHRQPQGMGYTEILVLRDAETIAPLAFPDFVLTAQQLFPPKA